MLQFTKARYSSVRKINSWLFGITESAVHFPFTQPFVLCRSPTGQVKGLSLGTVISLGSLPVFAGGIWYYLKTNPEGPLPVAQKPTAEEDPEERAMKKRFEEWMVVHKRRYKNEEEKARRYELFKGCVKRVNELNAASRPGEARYKPYRYADFTKEERSKVHGIVVEPSMFDEWNEEKRRKTQGGHDGGADEDDWEEQMRLIQRGLRTAALNGKAQRKAQQSS
ncbi:uncharacterized protein LOC119269997 isoform X1 [Triticum dicoccoides]|uniref:uncharacterized protein LOC119269997 isoform X1 n=1 Tax=Triticum dicoccoides TaxID=85692 RepID=UPI000E7937E5|nr:uncharacterized protein LOC119269997 isoform X1 [Triticum dicoccoides]